MSCSSVSNNKTRDISFIDNLVVPRAVENFSLFDQKGNFHELYYYSDRKAVILISQGNGCPITRQNVPYLRELKEKYEPQGVKFLMINANLQDDRDSIQQEVTDYQVDIPVLDDKAQIVSRSLGITRTAEAFLINPQDWTIVYQGAINDRFGYETQKTKPHHHYLADAIDALLENREIVVPKTLAKGCLIGYEDVSPTYTQDVAPILIRNCLPCHSPNGGAPWSMDNYAKVQGWGSMMREVVRVKRMPPWHADPYYGKFKDDISLTPQETRVLVRWIEQGFIKGEGVDPLLTSPRPQTGAWSLGEPDLVFVSPKELSIPAKGDELILDIKIGRPIENDLWVRAIDLRPSNLKVVHHGNVIVLPPDGRDQVVESQQKALTTEEKEEWFQRSGTTMDTGQMLSGYSPGSGPFVLLEGTGMFIPKGSRLLFRIHYVPTGKMENDLPTLGLYLYKEKPANILSVATITNRDIKIPAGVQEYPLAGSFIFEQNVLLTALTPHMHYRGKSMKFTVQYPDGRSEVVLSVPHYKFRWQRQYTFQEPKKIPAGTRIVAEAVYDNSRQNEDNPDPTKEVGYGPQSDREMFTAIVYYRATERSDNRDKR